MKQMIIAAACLLATFSAKAQAGWVTVTNWNNNCNIYFQLEGNVFSAGCTGGSFSSLYTFIPGQSQTFDATAVGLAAGDNLVAANTPDADASLGCGVTNWQVSDPCFGAPPSVSYTVQDVNCFACGPVTAVWTITGPSTANLDFY
jgi:hypothetical protein